jgi:hypothetical protein
MNNNMSIQDLITKHGDSLLNATISCNNTIVIPTNAPKKVDNKDRVAQLKAIQANAAIVFEKKNSDYGDAFAKHGIIGVLVRINDKINRALNVSKKGISLVEDESLRDTLLDLHNYAAMAAMLLDEQNSV